MSLNFDKIRDWSLEKFQVIFVVYSITLSIFAKRQMINLMICMATHWICAQIQSICIHIRWRKKLTSNLKFLTLLVLCNFYPLETINKYLPTKGHANHINKFKWLWMFLYASLVMNSANVYIYIYTY